MATIKVKNANNEWQSVAAAITKTIEVPAEPVIEEIEITENGTYSVPSGVDGYNPVIVNVPTGGGADLPAEAFNITGDCQYRFSFNGWNWFIENYGNQITTSNISNPNSMFYQSNKLTNIPFTINFKENQAIDGQYLFGHCCALREVPAVNNLTAYMINGMFYQCYNLREISENFINGIDWSYIEENKDNDINAGNMNSIFQECYSLRKLPMDIIKYNNPNSDEWGTILSNGFTSCACLDEAIDIPVSGNEWWNDTLSSAATGCYRLKNFIFETNEDGSPKVARWTNQNLDLSNGVGQSQDWSKFRITDYNSGITADKEVTDDATYQALKNDPDWFSCDVAYSRYNHDSAVATINSLPDTSEFLLECEGYNQITFNSAAGSNTDGGAISNLTEAEIAVAAAKGWTVTFI